MGQVIPIKVDGQRQLLARALDIVSRIRTGEINGMMEVLSRSDGEQESGISGVFLEDMDLAVSSARDGFNCLLGHRRCLEDPGHQPRKLRKEYEYDQSCSVLCGSRQ